MKDGLRADATEGVGCAIALAGFTFLVVIDEELVGKSSVDLEALLARRG